MHRNVKKAVAKALAVTLLVTAAGTFAPAPESSAAKKPKLSKTRVTLDVKKKAKIKIKNVKAKNVKKLTVKTSSKKTATVKKNGKTAFTITAKKDGKATITAKLTLKGQKKAKSLKVKVTVKKAGNGNTQTAAPTQSAQTPSASASAAPGGEQTTQPSPDVPVQTPAPTPLINYAEDFEDGLGDWFARGNECKLTTSTEAHNGKGAALIYDREDSEGKPHAWNGPAMDLSDCITPGGKYKVSFWAKIPAEDAAKWEASNGIELLVSSAKYYSKEDMDDGLEPSCENYPADTSYPIKADEWTQIEIEFTVPDYFYNFVFYVETPDRCKNNQKIRYGGARFLIDDVTLTRLTAPAEFDATLPSLKETYAEHGITMGVAATYGQLLSPNTFGFIKHHFSSVTAGNEMKLDAMMGSKKTIKITDEKAAGYIVDDAYKACEDNKDEDGDVVVPEIDFKTMDSYLKTAKENGMKVRIHSPFWHQQNPQHFFTKNFKTYTADETAQYVDKDTMYAREEMYVRTLLEHIFKSGYGDVVAAYDVVNEYLNMHNEGETYVNYWKFIFGTEVDTDSPYVKKAFAVARDELVKNNRTDISLIYNDYNTYNNTDKVIELINNINKQDDVMNPEGIKLCDGIGMQSHINGSGDEDKFEAAIAKFKDAGFEIQITELDVTNTGIVTADSTEESKAKVWEKNAEVYAKLMNAILNQKADGANITSVTVWGLVDATSWRSERAPLLFGSDVSDRKPSFDAVIDAAKNFGK